MRPIAPNRVDPKSAQKSPGGRFVFLNLHHPPVVDVKPNGDASHNGRPNGPVLAEFLA
jgi:hypothetical protein